MADEALLERLSASAQKAATPDATRRIATDLIQLVKASRKADGAGKLAVGGRRGRRRRQQSLRARRANEFDDDDLEADDAVSQMVYSDDWM